jgi:pyruvate ferredoxin oxidoreductase alpha subunit
VDVESEHSAMSAAIGAALAGARTITATSSQGLALMAEVVYIAAALRAPVVMAVGNRALSGPINIHCDHSDSMLVRDSGAIQLFAENAQEAYDLMLIAPRLAEHPNVLLPVLVCQDGFTITHSAEPVTLLDDEQARAFVGTYRLPNRLLDVAHPSTHGPFAMPDYYFELRHQQLAAMEAALDVFEGLAAELACFTGRRYRAVEPYALDGTEHAIVCLGSTGGTVKDVVDELRGEGRPVGLLEVRAFRPLPRRDLRALLGLIPTVSVLDRADSPGGAPPLYADLAAALQATDVELRSHVYGLGGRDLHPEQIRALFENACPPAYVGLRGRPCLV